MLFAGGQTEAAVSGNLWHTTGDIRDEHDRQYRRSRHNGDVSQTTALKTREARLILERFLYETEPLRSMICRKQESV
jgi:hypothetical protein